MVKKLMCDIKVAWWFRYLYMPLLISFCHALNTEPNYEEVEKVIKKACKIKVRHV